MLFEWLFKYPAELFARSSLVFAGRIPGELLLLAMLGLGALTWWSYRGVSGKVSRRAQRAVLGLRIALLAILCFMLAGPALRSTHGPSESVATAVLVDLSRSMSIPDVADGATTRSRLAAAEQLLAHRNGGLIKDLSAASRVMLFGFDGRATRLALRADGQAPAGALAAEGDATSFFRALRDVETETANRGVSLAAVVMLTDGCRNSGGTADEAARLLKSLGVPLYPVGLGNPTPPRDYEVLQVFAPRTVRRNSEVDLDVTVRHTDLREPFDLRVSRGDTLLLARTVTPLEGSDVQSVRLTLTPDHEGTAAYRVSIPPAPGEGTATNNNTREFTLDMQDDRLPVLYIEGSPRQEYRYLRRALFRDPDFRLVGLLRRAADNFYVQGANTAEAYLEKGFPSKPEELFAFEAVILGDIEAGFFTPAQLAMLEEFVRVRGGGLLMLGGVNSFGPGGYTDTPVGKMLPVGMSPSDPPYSDEQFTATLAPEALKHPVMRMAADPDANRQMWENAPPLIGITPVRELKAGATATLMHATRKLPVLAVQNYGQGRTAAFTSGGSWFWQMSMPASDEFHERFWKQLVRYLAVGARQRLSVQTDQDIYPGRTPVTIAATVLEKDLRPVSDALVIATVTDPLGNSQQVPMDSLLTEEGVYQCRFNPDQRGSHQVSVRVEGWTVKPAQTGFEVSEPYIEFSDAGLKTAVLENMARITGGRYFPLDQAGAVAGEVGKAVQRSALTRRAEDRMIWDMPALLALAIILASTEWLVRRRSGLA